MKISKKKSKTCIRGRQEARDLTKSQLTNRKAESMTTKRWKSLKKWLNRKKRKMIKDMKTTEGLKSLTLTMSND